MYVPLNIHIVVWEMSVILFLNYICALRKCFYLKPRIWINMCLLKKKNQTHNPKSALCGLWADSKSVVVFVAHWQEASVPLTQGEVQADIGHSSS